MTVTEAGGTAQDDRAGELSGEVGAVIIGSGPEVAGLAGHYHAAGAAVLVVGPMPAHERRDLARVGIDVRDRLTAPALERALASAGTVIVAGTDDDETLRAAEAVVRAAGTAPFPSVTLFDDPAVAQAWDRGGRHAVSRAEALALAALRALPPWPAACAAPPPFVVGDTPPALEITRRIAVGWQQPGERHTIHRIVRDTVNAGTLPGPADVTLDAASDAEVIVRAVTHRCAAWQAPPATHATLAGPSIYVTDADDPVALGALLAARVGGARVCVIGDVTPEPPPSPRLRLVSPRRYLADPAVLLLTPQRLLADEIFAEASHWPPDVPSLFGVFAQDATSGAVLPLTSQTDAVRGQVEVVAALADDVLRDLGIRLDAPGNTPAGAIVLTPHELVAITERLINQVPAPHGVDPAEHRQQALELAGRFPTLLARAGRHPRRPPGHRDPFAELPDWAAVVHAHYRLAVRRSGATDHANADRDWGELRAFEQASNRAQLADIPAKLAAVGLDCRPVTDPDAQPLAFSSDVVERLARLEHRRWEHFQRRNGRQDHRLAVPWETLDESARDLDRDAVRQIPQVLRFVGLEIVDHAAPDQPHQRAGSAGAPSRSIVTGPTSSDSSTP